MKICFMARKSYDRLTIELFLKMRTEFDSELKAVFITNDIYEANYIKSRVKDAEVYEIAEYIEKNWGDFNIGKLHEIEQKYKCNPIWGLIYSDRFLVHQSYEYCVKMTAGLFRFFEGLFENSDIDFYYDEAIATLQSYAAYVVGKRNGISYISQMPARGFDSTHHYYLSDPFQYNINFDFRYRDKVYSEKTINNAKNFLASFEKKNIAPAGMKLTGKIPSLRLGYIKLPMLYLQKRLSRKNTNRYSYMYYQAYKKIFNGILFYFRYHVSRKYYNAPDYEKKFIYYPLHYQPEASTLICAPKYEKQLFLVDSIAKSLPSDTMLFVKEHYALLGNREIEFYKKLKNYPNVLLINPLIDTFKLIKNSVAVITLTGTAGWEAMLLRKPVLLGGRIFFDNAPGIIKFDEIYNKFNELIREWKRPSREEVIKYLCEYIDSIREGNVYTEDPECYSEDNLLELARSLITQLENTRTGVI